MRYARDLEETGALLAKDPLSGDEEEFRDNRKLRMARQQHS